MRTTLVLVTGAVLGFIAVFFGYPGALFATVVAGGAAVYYTSLRRYADVGWLLIGAGSVVAALLGRVLLTGALDPAITISPPAGGRSDGPRRRLHVAPPPLGFT